MFGEAEDTSPFPYDHFLNYFPQFGPDKSSNTSEFLYACGNRAAMYLSAYQSAWLSGKRRIYALCLLAAHVVYLTNRASEEAGQGTSGGGGDASVGPVTSASVGGVSVSMQTPPTSNEGALQWWLNKSPYGQEFLAFVQSRGPIMACVGSRTPVLPLR